MGVIGTSLVVALVATAPTALGYVMSRMPAPTRSIEGPPHFAVDTGMAAKRRFYTVRPAELLMALVPGLLPWRYGYRSDALWQAALGSAGIVVIALLGHAGSIVRIVGFMGYFGAFNCALQTVRTGDAAARWMAFEVGINSDMARAECSLPSCPRCRQRDRDASGWCRPCHAALSAHALPSESWRARVGNQLEFTRDGSLLQHCAQRTTRSYFGSSGQRLRIPRAARRSGNPLPAPNRKPTDPEYDAVVEVAYVDPARHDLVWVRTREQLSLHGGDTYESRRVEAWGFLNDKFVQAWVFAPVSHGSLVLAA